MTIRFNLTYDYLCPFAAGANQTVVEALEDGADWQVRFIPFSLAATKVGNSDRAVWERSPGSSGTSGVQAHLWSLAVRELEPTSFNTFHSNLFSARHREAEDINDVQVLRSVATTSGVDRDAVSDLVGSGKPAEVLGREHAEAVSAWQVFGVPTFIMGKEAVFVRLMDYTRGDVDRVLDMLTWTNLNEFKRTSIPR
jgi:hypothetical protein